MASKMTKNNYKIIWMITKKVITLQLKLKAIYKTLAKIVIKIVITKFLNTQLKRYQPYRITVKRSFMLKQEFERLTGTQYSDEDYKEIESAYTSVEDMSKQEFADMWVSAGKKARNFILEMGKENKARELELGQQLKAAKLAIKTIKEKHAKVVNALFESACENEDDNLRNICIEEMGARTYLRKKLENDYELLQEDKDLILQELN